jgi:hypothetical protein
MTSPADQGTPPQAVTEREVLATSPPYCIRRARSLTYGKALIPQSLRSLHRIGITVTSF